MTNGGEDGGEEGAVERVQPSPAVGALEVDGGTDAAEDTVGDGAGDRADAAGDDVGADDAEGDACEDAGDEGGAEETGVGVGENRVEEFEHGVWKEIRIGLANDPGWG